MPAGLEYEPAVVLEQLGIHIKHTWLRDTWGAWCPSLRTIVIASGLSAVQERCILAHELEHVLADDAGCAEGPLAIRLERAADRAAARKLVAISDLAEVAKWAPDVHTAAAKLRVTERMLRVRLDDLEGEGWPWPQAGSKIAG
ncbi:ImmA/IrrE family metallo-endopeptidase [Streptomyces sp. XD-27]|uniref:ImmA/IrrE family metallo-endopeptidase n=1 Tax=Streptomyces sp. XD-27 TaxID=3062779 RepID=UPI0026F40D6F|nr:ImmA/IrrE family metallo-endopeptidase [Streptomyces sp. XD-27]WKX70067.1 ImmA/IrrE family metallo-endopeptidase [Streptomyces sp. XD-27]